MDIIGYFTELFSIKGSLVIINIILIDIVMSGDNAILIGMATRNLEKTLRNKAIIIGVGLATLFRIILSVLAVYLLEITGLVLAGGLLLIYVVWKFYAELRSEAKNEEHVKGKTNTGTLAAALYTIVIADISMSLDNVLAVSGASHGNLVALGFGLVFSIVLMAVASKIIAKYLDKYPEIQWIGLFVILFVAIEMIIKGSTEIGQHVQYNFFPFLCFILGSIFIVLNRKYIKPIQEEQLRNWFGQNHLKIIIFNLILFMSMLFFGDKISLYLTSHEMVRYLIIIILFVAALELVEIYLRKRK